MGEISDALQRAREEDERERERKRAARRSPGDVAESLRQAAVEEALEGELSEARPAPTPEEPPAPGPSAELFREGPALEPVPLQPREPSILGARHEAVEQCRHLANRVVTELERRGHSSLALVSALRMEGKSTVSINLALASATLSRGRSVALVDLDLRRPTVGPKLGLDFQCGIESVLQGDAPLDRARVPVQEPEIDVYPALPALGPAHELLVKPRFGQLIQELRQRYALVFFDTPPLLLVPDSNLILRHVEGCISVARRGVSRARTVKQLVDLLPDGKLIGSILNATRLPKHGGDYYGYYSSSDGEEASDEDLR